jgi:hypothetical protein
MNEANTERDYDLGILGWHSAWFCDAFFVLTLI